MYENATECLILEMRTKPTMGSQEQESSSIEATVKRAGASIGQYSRGWVMVHPLVCSIIFMVLAGGMLMPVGENAAYAQGANRTDIEIDHSVTGFLLTGGHAQVQCERCHVQGLFRGTPRQCMQCHSPGGRLVSTFKPANHIQTTVNCDSCHRTTAWKPAFFTHNGVKPGSCSTCHNNSTAVGKPATHMPSTFSCDSCHRSTVSWAGAVFRHQGIAPGACVSCHNGIQARGKPAAHVATTASCDTCHLVGAANWRLVSGVFNHAGVVPGTCGTCHNGTRATGKPARHIPTTAACDVCHRTTAWIPATMSHAGIAPGTCATCHNGTTARGKTANHIPTTQSCDVCHRTTGWIPATFSHTGIAPGTCATCHNGTLATGKSASHFVTTQSCDACHRAGIAWIPVTTYTHRSIAYKPHRSGVTCVACHTTNNEIIPWRFAAYRPDCAGCHAGDFRPDPHKKVDSPAIYYTVAELKDCAGSCHMYRDATFTTIVRTRTGQHSSTGGGF